MVVQHEKVCYDIIVHFYFHLEKTLGVGATIFPHGSDLAFIVCFYLIKYLFLVSLCTQMYWEYVNSFVTFEACLKLLMVLIFFFSARAPARFN